MGDLAKAIEELEDATDCAGAAREDDEIVAVSVGAINAVLDRLEALASRPAVAEGKPVAWRYRTAPHRQWHITDHRATADDERLDGSEVQPLYALAAPKP